MFDSLWDFEGEWRLEREIRHSSGDRATLSGKAVLTREEQGLHYHETGTLTIDGQNPMQAERRYIWTPVGRRGVQVLFKNGRAFHTIFPESPQSRHDCAPDVYLVQYEFGAWPVWRSHWDVSGPKKAYKMTSCYSRVS